jgi:hypothetical protein
MSHQHAEHKLHRAMARATIEAVEERDKRLAELAPLAAGDMAQQVQVSIEGKCGDRPIITELPVTWPHPFIMRVASNSRRDSTLNAPHFNYGIELKSEGHVLIDCQVRDWTVDDDDTIIGAKIRVSAWAPQAPKKRAYSAIAHLTFTGYAVPADDSDDDEE